MLELHYPTMTKTILERQYPGKPTLKVAFANDNGAIFEYYVIPVIPQNKPHAHHETQFHTMKVVTILISSFHGLR